MKMSDIEEAKITGEVEGEITIFDVQETANVHYERDNDSVLENRDHKYVKLTNVECEVKTRPRSNSVDENIKVKNDKRDRHSSDLWTKFTILSTKNYIASCNTCGAKLSFRSTTSNLRKHLIRKHVKTGKSNSKLTSYKPQFKQEPSTKSKFSELNRLILNVVGNDEEDPTIEITAHEVDAADIQNYVHSYSVSNEEEPASKERFNSRVPGPSETRARPSHQTSYTYMTSTPRDFPISERNEKGKRNQVLDLQMECLELKKYTMQMETLLLEQQLNLPRSIYTENLRGCENTTRGTQTDVGGSNTKVFFVTESACAAGVEGSQHLITFQAHLQE